MIQGFTLQSTSGITSIQGSLAVPAGPIKGLVQVVHGMAEYYDRYDRFRSELLELGYAVGGHDQLGHGKSAATAADLGYLGPKNGAETLVEDMWLVNRELKKLLPGVPVIAFGHGMGSLVTRVYLQRHADTLDAAILSGTPGPRADARLAPLLCRFCSALLGSKARSTKLDSFFFRQFNKRIPCARTRFDWLSTDSQEVDRYIEDPFCGFLFTTSALEAAACLSQRASSLQPMRPDLPLLLISGGEDPCGGYGEGVKKVAQLLEEGGARDVTVKLYPGMRHELHNDVCREEFMKYIKDWLARKLSKKE